MGIRLWWKSIEGRSVKYWMQRSLPELKDVLHIMIEVSTGVMDLHAKNIIHKDINPSNIIWNRKLKLSN